MTLLDRINEQIERGIMPKKARDVLREVRAYMQTPGLDIDQGPNHPLLAKILEDEGVSYADFVGQSCNKRVKILKGRVYYRLKTESVPPLSWSEIAVICARTDHTTPMGCARKYAQRNGLEMPKRETREGLESKGSVSGTPQVPSGLGAEAETAPNDIAERGEQGAMAILGGPIQ